MRTRALATQENQPNGQKERGHDRRDVRLHEKWCVQEWFEVHGDYRLRRVVRRSESADAACSTAGAIRSAGRNTASSAAFGDIEKSPAQHARSSTSPSGAHLGSGSMGGEPKLEQGGPPTDAVDRNTVASLWA